MTTAIGVQGASGGLGASSLVAALGLRAAQAGRSVVCVDHDADGGGLDVVLGVEQRPGLRWPDLRRARGVVDGAELVPALPHARGVGVVAHDRRQPREVPLAASEAVRRGLSAAVDVLVHDLPSPGSAAWPVLLRDLDLLALVVGTGAPQIAAAAGTLVLLEEAGVSAGLVVRGHGGPEIAALLGAPLLTELADDRSVPSCLARGSAPGSRAGALRAAADVILGAAVDRAVAA